jgi:3-deoxy-7-phosphoheptulonate synthase
MGADALIIEVHNNPSKALCDGVQSQTPEMFASMMKKLDAIKPYAWRRG